MRCPYEKPSVEIEIEIKIKIEIEIKVIRRGCGGG
jgi:hypothetical protein